MSHTTVPMTQNSQLASPRFAFSSECEKYEYIACFMEEWKHQIGIALWTLELGVPDSTQRGFEPQLDGQAHRASITSWNPNPEAFDFVPGVFVAPTIIEPRATMEQVEDARVDFEFAQAAYEAVRSISWESSGNGVETANALLGKMQSVRDGPSDGFHATTMGATVVLLLSILLLTSAVVLKLFQWRVVRTTLCKCILMLMLSFEGSVSVPQSYCIFNSPGN